MVAPFCKIQALDITLAVKADELDVILFYLPSNTTHELQRLDRVVSFEHFWGDELLKYWDQNSNRRLTKERFLSFSPLWEKCMSVANISSFRVTGIFPFDPQIIPEVAYAPSILSRRTVENLDTSDEESDAIKPCRYLAATINTT